MVAGYHRIHSIYFSTEKGSNGVIEPRDVLISP
jgi:hypothetical protein